MGDNTLSAVTSGAAAQATQVNQFRTALTGDFKPRNATSGAIEDSVHSLGSAATQWKNVYARNLLLNGVLFDPAAVVAGGDTNNAINSGRTRTTSGQPDFLRAAGSGASMTILATDTPLQITANASTVTIEADIAVSSLTVAPGSNNTCTVNDLTLTDQASSKYTGESISEPLTVDAMGSELTGRVGQYVCLKTPDAEYMLAFVESATRLSRCYRGFFFNSSAAPVPRGTLADNDVLTLMSLGWVFIDKNGTTVDVSYRSPTYNDEAPGSAAVDDYWFDMTVNLWNRYDGSDWQQVDRMLVGLVVIDGTNCVATRSFDFSGSYDSFNTVGLSLFSTTKVYSSNGRSAVSVYGDLKSFMAGPIIWDIAADLDTGLVEANSTTYYIYITESGQRVISDVKPYDRDHDLRGWYHPHQSWRCVGSTYNDGSGNLTSAVAIAADGMEPIVPPISVAGMTTFDFPVIPPQYSGIIVQFSGISSNTATRKFGFSLDFGAGFGVGVPLTGIKIDGVTVGSGSDTQGSIINGDKLIAANAATAAQSVSGFLMITPYQAGTYKQVTFNIADGAGTKRVVTGVLETTNALVGIRGLWDNTGTFDAGVVEMRGIK